MDENQLKWDRRFLKLAYEVATWSKDNSTQVGAYIIGPHRKPKSHGYNGLPRSINDNVPERHVRPAKYLWYEHAERNAIYNSDSNLDGCTIYVTHHPCADCARAIIQEQMTRVVIDKTNGLAGKTAMRFPDNYNASIEMLTEAGIEVVEITLNKEDLE